MDKKMAVKRASKIKMVVLDVDGVLTDGGIIIGSDGTEYKKFDVKDGTGITLGRYAGLDFAIISGRHSRVIALRGNELSVKYIYQDVKEKAVAYEKLKEKAGLEDGEICFIGDEIIDLPVMERCGLAAAPADAVAEARKAAHYVSKKKGGEGCVRDVIELVLKSSGLWKRAVAKYLRRDEK